MQTRLDIANDTMFKKVNLINVPRGQSEVN